MVGVEGIVLGPLLLIVVQELSRYVLGVDTLSESSSSSNSSSSKEMV